MSWDNFTLYGREMSISYLPGTEDDAPVPPFPPSAAQAVVGCWTELVLHTMFLFFQARCNLP